MENRDYLIQLFDIYKELLTKVEKETFQDYYEDDLSLSEIASNRAISKSSVGKTLKQAEDKLKYYEEILGVKILHDKIEEAILTNQVDCLKNI